MLPAALLLLLTWPALIDGLCPADNKPLVQCSMTSVFMLDASSSMKNNDNINKMMDYFETRLLARFDFPAYQNAYIMSYGANHTPYEESHAYKTACDEAETLRADAMTNGLQPTTLVQALKTIKKYYGDGYDEPIILFSASTDAADISAADDYRRKHLPDVFFTVIALNSNYTLWRNFHTISTYVVNLDQINDYQYLDVCILQQSCGHHDDPCFINPPPTTTSTRPPSTTISVAPSPAPSGQQCKCNPSTVYNDVMLMFDLSIGNATLQKTFKAAQSDFSAFNIQASTQNTNLQSSMRIGIVLYGDDAQLYSPLGGLSIASFQAIGALPFTKNTLSRLDIAIPMAQSQLSGSTHRKNSRQVIVIYGDQYSGAFNTLETLKHQFTTIDGVFVVYDVTGQLNYAVASLASDSLTIKTSDQGGITRAMCDVNCHCPTGSMAYKVDDAGAPIAGCYHAMTTNMNFALLQQRCSSLGGYITIDEDADKNQFLFSDMTFSSDQWIGLQYINGSYQWPDGSPLGSYQPWASGSPSTTSNCIVLSSDGLWRDSNCRNGFNAFCQIPPCDSTRPCGQ